MSQGHTLISNHNQVQEKPQGNARNMMWKQDNTGSFSQVPRDSMILPHKKAIPANVQSEEDDLENAYITIQQDPRYKRFLQILSPKWNGKGILQRARNYIDPSHIPGMGVFVHAYRAGQRGKTKDTIDDLIQNTEGTDANPDLVVALKNMRMGAHIEGVKETTAAVVSTFFVLFPINTIVPVENAAAKVVGFGAKKGVKAAVKSSATKAERDQLDKEKQNEHEDELEDENEVTEDSDNDDVLSDGEKEKIEGEEADVANDIKDEMVDSWGEVKAFFLYLGLAKNDDEIYSLWEQSRLKLKMLYGGTPEQDLWKEDENELTSKTIDDIRSGTADLNNLQVPLIELIWHIFDCRHLPYYHKVLEKPNRIKAYRDSDEKYYRRIVNNADPRAILLEKCHLEMIVNILTQLGNPFGIGSKLWNDTFSDTKTDEKETEKREEYMTWFATLYTKHFLSKQEVWGFADDEDDNRLLAVMLLEPVENKRPSLDRMLLSNKPRGSMKFGIGNYKGLEKSLKEPKKLRKKMDLPHDIGFVHALAFNRSLSEGKIKEISTPFLSAVLDVNSVATYSIVPNSSPVIPAMKEYGFNPQTDEEHPDFLVLKSEGKWKSKA